MQLMKDLDFIDQEFTVCARAASDGHLWPLMATDGH